MIVAADTVFDVAVRPSRAVVAEATTTDAGVGIDTVAAAGLVAAGLISGQLSCHRFAISYDIPTATLNGGGDDYEDNNDAAADDRPPEVQSSLAFSTKYHRGSCRGVDFAPGADLLFSVGKDKSLVVVDAATGKLVLKKSDAHSAPLNVVKGLSATMVVTGDEDGGVRVWDVRRRTLVQHWQPCTDYISDFAYDPATNDRLLLATSGDGSLAALDLRKKMPVKVSDDQEDDLSCVALVKNGKKAVVGSQSGTLSLFSAGNWGDMTDRLPAKQIFGEGGRRSRSSGAAVGSSAWASVDSLLHLDNDHVVAGCGDGSVRVLRILPNALEGVCTARAPGPVERLAGLPAADVDDHGPPSWVAGCAHDEFVRFWAVGTASLDDDDDDDDSGDGDDSDDDSDDDSGGPSEEDGRGDGAGLAPARPASARPRPQRRGAVDDDSDSDSDNANDGGDGGDDDDDAASSSSSDGAASRAASRAASVRSSRSAASSMLRPTKRGRIARPTNPFFAGLD
ncbi:WD domain repeat-containing protein 55 [Cladochytrium tenue]|nr:WD domain repeat-containing protein 55 [Cladochytrium tenue]